MVKFENLKSQFEFTRSEQIGILLLSLSIALVWVINLGIDKTQTQVFDLNSEEVRRFQIEMDSLRKTTQEKFKPKLYPFNPNFISDFKGYVLGLKPEEVDALNAFREKGNWIRSAAEFQKITGVSHSWLDSIAPFFKFPKWKGSKKKNTSQLQNLKLAYSEKIDLNVATHQELQQVYGIGEVFSKRILQFRDNLGGFSHDIQLYFVHGIKKETIDKLLNGFTVKTPVPIDKQNINQLSASDLSTLPGISFQLGVTIWEFIQSKNGIDSLDELQKIDEITPQKIALIQLYLSAK